MKPQLHISKNGLRMIQLTSIDLKNDILYKPKGGFWTSTYTPNEKYISAWVEWCSSEEPGWLVGKYYIVYPKKEAKIFRINSYKDLSYLFENYPLTEHEFLDLMPKYTKFIDWVKVSKDFDAVHMTEKGELIARGNCTFFLQDGYSLYGWDCESTLWFRDVFEKIKYLKEVKNDNGSVRNKD